VKIRKPEDEKYFKDVVLKDIFEEISKENGIKQERIPQKALQKKRRSQYLLFLFMVLLLILFTLITMPFLKGITTKDSKITITTYKKKIKEEWKMPEDRDGYVPTIEKKMKKITPKQIPARNHLESKKVKRERSKSEKELAIEKLRQQLLD